MDSFSETLKVSSGKVGSFRYALVRVRKALRSFLHASPSHISGVPHFNILLPVAIPKSDPNGKHALDSKV